MLAMLLEGEELVVLGRETREQCLKPEVGCCVNDPYEYERVVWFSFSTGKESSTGE